MYTFVADFLQDDSFKGKE